MCSCQHLQQYSLLSLLLLCRLTLELRDRQARVEVLGTKFDTLSSKNRATDPEGGEPKSQAYYIIKVRTRSRTFLKQLVTCFLHSQTVPDCLRYHVTWSQSAYYAFARNMPLAHQQLAADGSGQQR